MDDLVNRPGIGLEVADEVLIVASLTQCREAELLVELHRVVQYIDAQPARIHEDFNRFAVEALRANWPCSLVAGARDPLAVVPH
jgi:hypothetical protein